MLMYLVEEVASSGAVLWTPELPLLFWCALVTRFNCKFTLCAHGAHTIVAIWYLCVLVSVSSEDMSVCTMHNLVMCACLLQTTAFVCFHGWSFV